jgi:hypothetical protein
MWFASGEESNGIYIYVYLYIVIIHKLCMYNITLGCHVLEVFHMYIWFLIFFAKGAGNFEFKLLKL